MELRHLRYFTAVAAAENVSRAALTLHVSQPALSRQIRDLESELGVALFERTPKSLRLTGAGRAFLPEAQAVLRRVEAAAQVARDAGSEFPGVLNVGYAPTPTVRLLPAALRLLQRRHPGIRVRLHDLSTDGMMSGLREGTLDLALLILARRSQLRGLASEELLALEPRLAVAPGHVLARNRFVTPEALSRAALIGFSAAEYPEYRDLLKQVLGAKAGPPRLTVEHDSAASLIAAVESGFGAAIVTESMGCVAGPRLRLIPIRPPPPPFRLMAAWRSHPMGGGAQAFLAAAREAARDAQEPGSPTPGPHPFDGNPSTGTAEPRRHGEKH